MKLERFRGHYLWALPLRGESVVVDAGAHRGEFSTEIFRRFGCQCHLIEANPLLVEQLSVHETMTVTSAALGARDGMATFHLRENPEAGSLGTFGTDSVAEVKVETVSLPTFMERRGIDHIDLLKLDIEGAEFDLIRETTDDVLRRIGQITVEFHDFQERFAGQSLFEKACTRLNALGFICCRMSFRTNGDVLFFNQELLRLTWPQVFYAKNVARFVEKARTWIL